MKKTILMVALTLILGQNAFSDELQQTEALELQMPSDEEILKTIERYSFDNEQKQFLLQETKKKIREIYAQKNPEAINSTLQQMKQQIESTDLESMQ